MKLTDSLQSTRNEALIKANATYTAIKWRNIQAQVKHDAATMDFSQAKYEALKALEKLR